MRARIRKRIMIIMAITVFSCIFAVLWWGFGVGGREVCWSRCGESGEVGGRLVVGLR